jgi:uncharacterized iron-regulated protein
MKIETGKIGKKLLTIVILTCITLNTIAQKPAYRLFRENGKKTKYEKMLVAASEADVVLFGEYHNNPIVHWLQLELTRDLYLIKGEKMVLGAEMFESDNQMILDEYLSGLITEEKFEDEARLWKNYKTDYKPLVLFAKNKNLKFVATNVPRRYANSVYKQGVGVLDDLSDEARRYIAPLPLEYDTSLTCYRALIRGESGMHGHGSINLADAQAIKDATMSHFIVENWQEGVLFVHFNGAGHSDSYENINWFLNRTDPELKIVTITMVSQDKLDELEAVYREKADYIIAVSSFMTKTH